MGKKTKKSLVGTPSRPLRIGVVDLFCGCGGASYGFLKARVSGAQVRIITGIDIDKHCCATYERMRWK